MSGGAIFLFAILGLVVAGVISRVISDRRQNKNKES
jgi:hypothetical protein